MTIDAASLGRFSAINTGSVPDSFVISYQIDGLPAVPAPLISALPTAPSRPYFCVMARGTKALYDIGPNLRGPLEVNGIELRNMPTPVLASIPGCVEGSVLKLRLDATTDRDFKIFAFDNIRVLGVPITPGSCCTGSCCNGVACTITAGAGCTGTFVPCGVCAMPQTTCCRDDFNRSGHISFQDLFDFLAAYFGGCP